MRVCGGIAAPSDRLTGNDAKGTSRSRLHTLCSHSPCNTYRLRRVYGMAYIIVARCVTHCQRVPVTVGTTVLVRHLVVGIDEVNECCSSPLPPLHATRPLYPQANGQLMVWGKKAEYITASYINARGDKSSSLLLCTGWWGVARHFHYLPEITGAFFWTVPALFENATPYFYVVFLVLLLTDRAFRDDVRCRGKYGKHWDKVRGFVVASLAGREGAREFFSVCGQ